MSKAERIKAYNDLYPGFNIMGIKKMTTDREHNTQNAKEIE